MVGYASVPLTPDTKLPLFFDSKVPSRGKTGIHKDNLLVRN